MLKSSSSLEKNSITSIAIGGFDGIHLAHQQLLSRLDEKGAVVIIEKGFAQALTPREARCRYTGYPCVFLEFDEIREMDAEAFMRFLQREFPSLRKIVVGYDFRFGRGRMGTPKTLGRLSGVEVEVVEEQKLDGISIHANTIRRLLSGGDIVLANRLLGRPYTIAGNVIRGQGLGKKVLYPTINIDAEGYLLPKEGVYVTGAWIGGHRYPALTFIGNRVSTDNAFSVETHILHQQISEKVAFLEIGFEYFLRPNRKFDTLEALKQQIGEDIAAAKGYFQAQA